LRSVALQVQVAWHCTTAGSQWHFPSVWSHFSPWMLQVTAAHRSVLHSLVAASQVFPPVQELGATVHSQTPEPGLQKGVSPAQFFEEQRSALHCLVVGSQTLPPVQDVAVHSQAPVAALQAESSPVHFPAGQRFDTTHWLLELQMVPPVQVLQVPPQPSSPHCLPLQSGVQQVVVSGLQTSSFWQHWLPHLSEQADPVSGLLAPVSGVSTGGVVFPSQAPSAAARQATASTFRVRMVSPIRSGASRPRRRVRLSGPSYGRRSASRRFPGARQSGGPKNGRILPPKPLSRKPAQRPYRVRT